MISRIVLGAFLALVTAIGGVTSYLVLDARQSKVAVAPVKPTAAQPTPHAFAPAGTIYLAQAGALYSYSYGRFHQLTTEDGWTQVSLTPDGNLIAVRRGGFSSDVYILNRYGRVLRQLTNNAAPRRSYDTGDNHWAFYPRMTGDGNTIFLSYDKPKGGYEVDLSVWSMPLNGGIGRGTDWTYSEGYTGGDMQPIPAPGGLIYTKYLRADDGSIHSQIWWVNRPYPNSLYAGRALTSQGQDCRSPSFTTDFKYVAMVCTYGQQVSNLVIAPFHGSTLGPLTTLITGQMVAQPVWAPDGSGIAYLAPALPDMPFQLWFLPAAAYAPPPAPSPAPSPSAGAPAASPSPQPSPSPAPVVKPIQLTLSVGLDATSTLAWAP